MIKILTSTQKYGIYKNMLKTNDLTTKQKNVLKFIYSAIRQDNLPPTIREIAKQFGFSSTGTVRDYLNALVKKGFIKVSSHKSRAIELVSENLFAVPILGKVRSGLPTLAVEEIEGYLNLDSLVFSDEMTFALRVRGDSMIDAGILADDLVLVRKQNSAQNEDVVVALVEEDATVKYLRRHGSQYFLEPANNNYAPILVNETVSILGKVISVVRRF